MKFEEYRRLRNTSMEEVSREDKRKRKEELRRRLKICRSFLKGVHTGYMPKHVEDNLPDDDPMKEHVNDARILINNIPGEAQ